MNLLNKKEACCGCTACSNVCPKEAISMIADDEGFLYPIIKDELCVECGLCKEICSFHDSYDVSRNYENPLVYAARHRQKKKLLASRSGAIFIALSDVVLQNGGLVYGVGYDSDFAAVYKRAATKEERNEFRGSKYVQANLENVFRLIKIDLQQEKTVLFSGTPCHTAGLRSFLAQERVDCAGLYMCDIICHGVPSPMMWHSYLVYIKNKYKQEILSVNFRDKEYGWNSHLESFLLSSGRKIVLNIYTDLFYKHLMFRPACGNCKYTNFQRPSDITLGDYWGWQKRFPEFNKDDMGVSLILVNTDKGKSLFERAVNDFEYLESSVDKCLQPNLVKPSAIPRSRDAFWSDFQMNGFRYIAKKYGVLNWPDRTKFFLRMLKRALVKVR